MVRPIHYYSAMQEKRKRSIKSYVLRTGRMTGRQRKALDEAGPEFIIPLEQLSDGAVPQIFSDTIKRGGRIIAEIGFGNGEAAALMAERNRSDLYLGIEVYPPGVGNLLKLITEKGLENIRIFNRDAVEVLDALEGTTLIDGFHVFFPDPWQKKKHNKRRLVNEEFALKMASLLKEGGYIYAVTDWEDYGHQMQQVFRDNPSLCSPFEGFADTAHTGAPDGEVATVPWRPETGFEKKGKKKNHGIYESFFIKKTGKT